MSKFERGLDCDFVTELNELYRQGSWWTEMVDDGETFLGIRKNSVNVYFRGASLARIERSREGIAAHVHYKYLLKPNLTDEYVRFDSKGRVDPSRLENLAMDHIGVALLKASAKNYAGDEKTGVHAIAVRPDNAVVDVEVAISDGVVARRVDLAALVETEDSIAVRFFEVKAHSNGELRAADKVPPVVEQIGAYQELVREHESEIVESYCDVCKNLNSLNGRHLAGRRGALIQAVATDQKPLVVDVTPRLVVFGYDQDQRVGSVWRGHLKRLTDNLDGKPIAAGEAKNVRLAQ